MAFYDVERRTAKNKFFKQIDTLIDWTPIEKELKKVYRGGKKERGQKAYDRLLKKINRQLDKHHLIIKDGMKVDASLTENPFKPKGKITYEIATDRQEDQRDQKEIEKEESFHKLKKVLQPGSDEQARWVKKRGKNTFGYKTRWVVERTFGSMKLWFGSGVTRLKGIEKVHGVHVMEVAII